MTPSASSPRSPASPASPASRPYRMHRRAESIDRTRERIVEAAVELHGTRGPAHTSVAAVAERAGVTRTTVYRHFRDDAALFDACSTHWAARQAPPDLAGWRQVPGAEDRLRAGLADLYRYYREGAAMLRLVHRDREALPDRQQRALAEDEAAVRRVLGEPLRAAGAPGRQVRAAIGLAVAFTTWDTLCGDERLSDCAAADLMTRLVLSAGRYAPT